MSGFLRNLSTQALGLAKNVRSTARLPYAAVPAILEQSIGDDPGAPLTDAPSGQVDRSLTAPSHRAIVESADSREGFSVPFLVRDSGGLDTQHPALAMREPADDANASSISRRVGSVPPLVQPATRFVLPPAPAATAPAATPSAYRRSSGSETTEVHVTIGRIDVTAAHEPATPKRRVPDRKSQSLVDYLAKGQRGRG